MAFGFLLSPCVERINFVVWSGAHVSESVSSILDKKYYLEYRTSVPAIGGIKNKFMLENYAFEKHLTS